MANLVLGNLFPWSTWESWKHGKFKLLFLRDQILLNSCLLLGWLTWLCYYLLGLVCISSCSCAVFLSCQLFLDVLWRLLFAYIDCICIYTVRIQTFVGILHHWLVRTINPCLFLLIVSWNWFRSTWNWSVRLKFIYQKRPFTLFYTRVYYTK